MSAEEEIAKALSYCPSTGVLTWKAPTGNGVRAGDEAGRIGAAGYRLVQVGRKVYRAHRIAWLLSFGHWPPNGVDHINGLKADNRLSNLRLATPAENSQNVAATKRNRSGFLGVDWFKPARLWRARIMSGGKQYALGYFHSAEEAAVAYAEAKAKLHTFSPVVRTTHA